MEQMIRAGLPWSDGAQIDRSPYRDLAAGIVLHAIKDYTKVLQKLWKPDLASSEMPKLIKEKLRIEEFFYSPWFETLTDLDQAKLISKCYELAMRRVRESVRNHNAKRIRKLKEEYDGEEKKNERAGRSSK